MPNSNYDFSDIIARNQNAMFLFESTKEKVLSVIKRIEKNENLHDISMSFIRITSVYLSSILSDLFNLCIEQRTYPDVLKVYKVTRIYNKHYGERIENY